MNDTPQKRNMPNLDLLRSVAIALVVLDHTLLSKGHETGHAIWGRWQTGDLGLFGVYLFFVHTSLVLMWSLERRPNTLDFTIRRIFRIYPLAILAILIAALTHAPVAGYPGHYFSVQPWTKLSLLINCLLMQQAFQHSPSIHGVTWSLPPELYMYVLLPCLFLYARSLQKTRQLWPLLALWVLTVLVDRATFSVWIGNSFPILIPDFLSGVVAYVGFMRRKPTLPSWTLLPLLALLLAAFMSTHRIRADWYACLALALILPSIKQLQRPPLKLLAHKVATYSFGIYLFHPFGIVLGMYLLAGWPLGLQLAIELSFTAAAAVLGYHLLEKPMIDLGARIAAKLAGERGLPSPASLDNLEPAP